MMTSWKRWLPAFAAGLLAGVLLSVGAARHFRRGFRDPVRREHHMLERFSRKLSLTPDQKAKVGAILQENGRRMRGLWDEMRPKADELRKTTDAEIRALLTPEQQEKFDVFHKKMEKRWKDGGPGGPGGPERPPEP